MGSRESSQAVGMDPGPIAMGTVDPRDSAAEMAEVRELLEGNDLTLEAGIEVFVVGRSQGRIVACAGLDHATIKCVAVARAWRGESLSLRLGTEIVRVAAQRGRYRLFLYTPPPKQQFFRGWGFNPIVEVPGLVVFMENSPTGIREHCDRLRAERRAGRKIGGIVLNANPFTLGHRYLVEQAAAACEWLHVFVVGEDASYFSYADRIALVAAGVKGIDNLTLHAGSDYIISRATFPGYFLRDEATVARSWAAIDLLVFREYIAPALAITHRFVGTEPFDAVTDTYNAEMQHWLQEAARAAPPVIVVEVPRATVRDVPISASEVRRRLTHGDLAGVDELVPPTTLEFLKARLGPSHQRSATGG